MSTDNLCLDCGLCCTGKLFTQIELLPGERRVEFGRLEDGTLSPLLQLPCPAFDGGCTVYATRPVSCREYRCAMLNAYERGEFTYEQCLEMIAAEREKV